MRTAEASSALSVLPSAAGSPSPHGEHPSPWATNLFARPGLVEMRSSRDRRVRIRKAQLYLQHGTAKGWGWSLNTAPELGAEAGFLQVFSQQAIRGDPAAPLLELTLSTGS